MWKYFDTKVFKKLLVLGVLSCGLTVAFFTGAGQTRATMICCDLCEPNYNTCISMCGVSETCGDECATVRDNCVLTCGVGDC